MRVVKLRRTAREDGRRVRKHRLIIRAGSEPLAAGDVVEHPDGFRHTLRGWQVGVPVQEVTRRLYETTRADLKPVVFLWEFDCERCGRLAICKRAASWRPTRRRCFHCRAEAGDAAMDTKMDTKIETGMEVSNG